MVYGIIELINFAHFNVFMVGSFIAMWTLEALGFAGQSHILHGLPLAGILLAVFIVTMLGSGILGVAIERFALRPLRGVSGTAPMITTIGVSYILYNIVLLGAGADSKNYSNPMPNTAWAFGGVTLRLREVLLWGISLLLMVGLNYFVRRTKMGKAMRAMAQDQEAARMVGVDVDRVVVITFFVGSALAGAAGLIFGLYYNYTSYLIGYTSGLRAFTAAVLGGIGNIPGAMLGGVVIGLIESLGGQYIAVRWTDVIIFSLLVLVLVLRPSGLLGRAAPTKS
ncbi:branched-chain amino acid ABC transporter permease [Bradyrhizobium genosp. P]|uniref:branched-chain amino acid ABC transporter permease n=1 Tax=Bradyrhizobium genosp. P TaxID=83641 RepID=UPI003CF68485